MVRVDLVKKIKESTVLTAKDADKVVDIIFNAIKEAMLKGERIELRGLGTLGVKQHAARIGRNLKTGEAIPLPPRRVPFFKPGKELKIIPIEIKP